MNIIYVILATWTIVGTMQWCSWVVRTKDLDIEVDRKLESPWQWFWAGPVMWILRFVCYFIRAHMP